MAKSTDARTVEMPALVLRAEVAADKVDEASRTAEIIFSTGAPVERVDWFTGERYIETLSLDPKDVRLERLNNSAPLLNAHSSYDLGNVIGVVEPGSATISAGRAVASVRFSKRADVDPIWQDVRDGIIRHVSVGYHVHKYEVTAAEGGKAERRHAVDWEPYEISAVPMGADDGAKVRGEKPKDMNPCEIVGTRTAEERDMQKRTDEQSEFVVEPPALVQPPERQAPKDPPEPTERDLGVAAEAERAAGILSAVEAGRLPSSFGRKLIEEKVSLVEAQRRVLAEIATRDGSGPEHRERGPVVEVGDDPLVHARAGIANALLHRIAPERHSLEDIGRPYRGMTVLDIGRAFLNARGVRVTRMSRSELVDAMLSRGGMHTTSDFPYLLEDVAHKNLRSAYEAAPQTWLVIAKPINLSDFKPSRQLQVGDAPALEEILEHGEFTEGTITEAKETVQLKTYGKVFSITRAALINDDLNAFGEIPAAFGRKARDKESDLAWACLTANPTMGDGNSLFDSANHGNYTSSGTAISVDSLGVGRKLMRLQKGIDGATPLNLSPRYLIVPATKETIADQYVTVITPADNAKANPFAQNGRTPLVVVVEPRLDGSSTTAWYLACGVEQSPVLYYGTLDGQSGPDLRQQEGFDVDGLKFRCRLDVAFKAADWRAIYKNAGA
ncbi:MAG: peptidase U37 [Thermoleophilia bacterium]|nr:peptidase U37 [Thermoleophilia bacterium]